ncbi:hypothetical protein P7K49_007495, partial [Saguinus oedipus]
CGPLVMHTPVHPPDPMLLLVSAQLPDLVQPSDSMHPPVPERSPDPVQGPSL